MGVLMQIVDYDQLWTTSSAYVSSSCSSGLSKTRRHHSSFGVFEEAGFYNVEAKDGVVVSPDFLSHEKSAAKFFQDVYPNSFNGKSLDRNGFLVAYNCGGENDPKTGESAGEVDADVAKKALGIHQCRPDDEQKFKPVWIQMPPEKKPGAAGGSASDALTPIPDSMKETMTVGFCNLIASTDENAPIRRLIKPIEDKFAKEAVAVAAGKGVDTKKRAAGANAPGEKKITDDSDEDRMRKAIATCREMGDLYEAHLVWKNGKYNVGIPDTGPFDASKMIPESAKWKPTLKYKIPYDLQKGVFGASEAGPFLFVVNAKTGELYMKADSWHLNANGTIQVPTMKDGSPNPLEVRLEKRSFVGMGGSEEVFRGKTDSFTECQESCRKNDSCNAITYVEDLGAPPPAGDLALAGMEKKTCVGMNLTKQMVPENVAVKGAKISSARVVLDASMKEKPSVTIAARAELAAGNTGAWGQIVPESWEVEGERNPLTLFGCSKKTSGHAAAFEECMSATLRSGPNPACIVAMEQCRERLNMPWKVAAFTLNRSENEEPTVQVEYEETKAAGDTGTRPTCNVRWGRPNNWVMPLIEGDETAPSCKNGDEKREPGDFGGRDSGIENIWYENNKVEGVGVSYFGNDSVEAEALEEEAEGEIAA